MYTIYHGGLWYLFCLPGRLVVFILSPEERLLSFPSDNWPNKNCSKHNEALQMDYSRLDQHLVDIAFSISCVCTLHRVACNTLILFFQIPPKKLFSSCFSPRLLVHSISPPPGPAILQGLIVKTVADLCSNHSAADTLPRLPESLLDSLVHLIISI